MLALHYLDGVAMAEDAGKARLLLAEAEAADSDHVLIPSLRALFLYMDAETREDVAALMPVALGAAERGGAYAQGLLAVIYAFEEGFKDPIQAEKWARLTAGQANYMGQYVLGWLYINGLIVERNDAMAWAYLDTAMQYAQDLDGDPEGPLLKTLEKRVSAKDRERGTAIRNGWLFDWGLRDTP